MQNDYIKPVDHGALSTLGTMGVGAAAEGGKSFSKTLLWSVGICTMLGAAIGVGIMTAGAGTIFTGPVIAGLVGAGAGSIVGLGSGSFLGAFTGIAGAGKGAIEAHERVSQQKGAMQVMQMAAYQSAAANQPKYNFPPQGSPMNPAMANVQAANAATYGTVAGQGIERSA